MVGINVFKRLPRPVFALALMALALVAGGSATAKHDEAATPSS
jgi:outer membrane murein-binding lipoprotein Lpp